MKRLLFLFSVLFSLSAYSQEPLDSAFWEMEDSVSSLAIKPIKRPKELLMRILERLKEDVEQKHSRRDYQLEAVYNIRTPPTLHIKQTFTVEADNGIEIRCGKFEDGPLQFDGPYRITKQDSARIHFHVATDYDTSNLHLKSLRDMGDNYEKVTFSYLFSNYKLDDIHKMLMKDYRVKAYDISNALGRGVYRIELEEKKSRNRPSEHFYFKWYVDHQSLRLTQINADIHVKQNHTHIQQDFREEKGSPFLTKYSMFLTLDKHLMHKTSITLIEK